MNSYFTQSESLVELILWRHAEAEDGFPDQQRALTEKGHQDAQAMAQWLLQRLPKDCQILVSPALRAQQTASYLQLPMQTIDNIAPGASGADVLQAAGWGMNKKTVLIVGHQPSLGMAASLAMTRKSYYWCVKKGSIWWLANRMQTEDQETIIRCVLQPDMLRPVSI